MRLYLPSILLYFTLILSNFQLVGAELGIADLPACGLKCLLITVPAAGCSLADTKCQCSNQDLVVKTSACMVANCTMEDTRQMARVQADLCHLPHPSRRKEGVITVSALFSVALFSVLLRFLSRGLQKKYDAEDWVILAALILSVPCWICVLLLFKRGFGRHVWDLEYGALEDVLRLFFVAENIYIVVLGLTKLSIICLYLRLFWTYPTFRRAAWATLGLVTFATFAILIPTIFSCKPVDFFWNREIKGGYCRDVSKIAYANSAVAIVLDLLIIILPLFVLSKLNIHRRKKIFIALMFGIGGIGCITTIIRLQSLLVFGESYDPTWDYVNVIYWTEAELACGMIVSSLPAIRILFERVFKGSLTAVRSRRSRAASHRLSDYPTHEDKPNTQSESTQSRRSQGDWWDAEADAEADTKEDAESAPPHRRSKPDCEELEESAEHLPPPRNVDDKV